jgi:hypothetical protein
MKITSGDNLPQPRHEDTLPCDCKESTSGDGTAFPSVHASCACLPIILFSRGEDPEALFNFTELPALWHCCS